MANLSMKELDVRLKAVEDIVYSLDSSQSAPPEWLDDVLKGVINALFQLRQQGAYNLALELEAKYFPDGGVETVGDQFTTSSGLKRSGG